MLTFEKVVIPGPPQAEPGIQFFANLPGEPDSRLRGNDEQKKTSLKILHPLSAHSLNSSLTLVFARVFASTCLTITAAYRLWLPSLAGRLPDTTTLPAGTRP